MGYVIIAWLASCVINHHMSIRIGFSLLLLVCHQLLAQSPVELTSSIEKVTVFQSGAQVERTASHLLRPGKYQLVFPGISPRISKESIQLKADGKLTILSVTHQQNFLKEQKTRESIQQIQTLKEQWLEKQIQEKNTKSVFAQEEKMILANQSIKGDATLKAAELKEAADFQRQRLTEVYQKQREADLAISRIDQEIGKLNRQLQELNQQQDLSTSEIVAQAEVKETSNASFRLSYLVKESSWYASYDVRVTDIASPINLLMKANLKQQSGEDWKDVKLFLSTGNPSESGTRPSLSPWFIRYGSPSGLRSGFQPGNLVEGDGPLVTGIITDQQGNPISGATVMKKGTTVGTTTDNQGRFALKPDAIGATLQVSSVGFKSTEVRPQGNLLNIVLAPDQAVLQEVVVMGYGASKQSNGDGVDDQMDYAGRNRRKKEATAIETSASYQPTTTLFEIETPYSVPSDGKSYTVDISQFEIQAAFEYYCVPKLDPSAFLTARITDWQELHLMPGETSLFFEGTYLGKSYLDLAGAGDTLNLSLGKDKNVVVKRTKLKEFSAKKFLGNSKTDTRQFEISVRNNKPQPLHIVIEDQFPVSTSREIEVEKLSYDGATLDEGTRKLVWAIDVEAKKDSKLVFGYTVKYPRDRMVVLD